jgi:hypothetical protein
MGVTAGIFLASIFNKRDALSSLYKISMDKAYAKVAEVITQLMTQPGLIVFVITNPFFLRQCQISFC